MNHATPIALFAAVSASVLPEQAWLHQSAPMGRDGHQLISGTAPTAPPQAESVTQRSSTAMTDPHCDVPLQQWLSFVPTPFDVCGGATFNFPALGSSGRFDVDGNGDLDFVEVTNQFEAIWSGQVLPVGDIVTASELVTDVRGTIQARRAPVFRPGTAIGIGIRSIFPDANYARIYVIGWRDMDGDGDLDLVTFIQHGASSPTSEVNCFFENIGYEKPAPPLAADINRDGRVDGADLGMLLIAWGPTP
jgi:hypothetical protein